MPIRVSDKAAARILVFMGWSWVAGSVFLLTLGHLGMGDSDPNQVGYDGTNEHAVLTAGLAWMVLLFIPALILAFLGYTKLEYLRRWSLRQAEETRCDCGYLLTGLESRRCPECGAKENPKSTRTRIYRAALLVELLRFLGAGSCAYAASLFTSNLGPPAAIVISVGGAVWWSVHRVLQWVLHWRENEGIDNVCA